MSLKLSKWASIAEIISGVAIVLTIGLLVFEMRQNTNEIQAATHQEMINQLNNWRMTLAENPELSHNFEILWQGGDWDQISKEQQTRLNFFMNPLWGMYENAYFGRQRGIIGDSEWSRWEKVVCQLHKIDQGMWRRRTRILSDEFLGYLERCKTKVEVY